MNDDPLIKQLRQQISDTDRSIVDAINARLRLVDTRSAHLAHIRLTTQPRAGWARIEKTLTVPVVAPTLGFGARGASVRAANRGVVALVADLYLSGTTVLIDHGAGLVTGYLHLSRTLVAVGDTVTRGQEIGEVGASGRVTGPHLHWLAAYGGITFDPLGLVGLDLDAAWARSPKRARP